MCKIIITDYKGEEIEVAVSHAAKKLVRFLYQLETTGEAYLPAA